MQRRVSNFFILTLLCILFLGNKISAQISADQTQGCAPLNGVNFQGESGASNIQWNFGDGSFAPQNNPQHTFTTPGTYTVTYTATVGSGPVTESLTISVFSKPTAAFSIGTPNHGCAPLSVPFTDQSTGGGGTAIVGWNWDFGDAILGSTQNPTHAYNNQGNYVVTLQVTDANGCDNFITSTDTIRVSQKPTVLITSNGSSSPTINACHAPDTITFNGIAVAHPPSPLPTTLTYQWDFGNSTTSNVASPPQVIYPSEGTYSVTLTCTDVNGCSYTSSVTVNILQPVALLTIQDTVCKGASFQVQDNSTANSVTINYGDGTANQNIAAGATNTHTYNIAGNHTVTVTANMASCTATTTYNIFVDSVIANFTTAAPHFTCDPTKTVTFNSTSTGASSPLNYLWVFFNGDTLNGDSSIIANPTETFDQNSLNPYTIYQGMPVGATLYVTTPFGCKDSITIKADTIKRPTAYFYTDGMQGCAPLTITFTDSSFSDTTIINYEWHFGDTTAIVSGPTDSIVTHTYVNPGHHDAYLVITNADGCIDTSFVFDIITANSPAIDFTFDPTTVCPYDPVTINNLTDPADSVQHWHVISDDSYFSGCITDPNPSWNYTHTGVHDVTLVGYTYGCRGATTSSTQVTVKGPIVDGWYYTQCGDSALHIKFQANLQDVDNATWDFGDGTSANITGSGIVTTYHVYSVSGNYTAIITGTNNTIGCNPSVDTVIVTARNLHASFTNDTNACSLIATPLDASASTDVKASCGIGYSWIFLDTLGNKITSLPPVVTSNAAYSPAIPQGDYIIKLIVKDDNDCHDTTTNRIHVSYVQSAFALDDYTGCYPSYTLHASDSSVSDFPITNWSWNFGDGTGNILGQDTSHTYNNLTGTYTVTLNATNTLGCTNTSSVTVTITHPTATLASVAPSCLNTNIHFSCSTPGTTITQDSAYVWNFGDGTADTTTLNNTNHSFTTPGTYTVSVNVTDDNGCPANTSTVIANVAAPPTPYIHMVNGCSSSGNYACSGCAMSFHDSTDWHGATTMNNSWSITGLATVNNVDSVGHIFTGIGTSTVTLTVNNGVCPTVDTSVTISIYGASADFSYSAPSICIDDSIVFSINTDSSMVETWQWDFGDGNPTVYEADQTGTGISHQFTYHPPNANGADFVTLTYWSTDSACRYSVTHEIDIYQVIADFNRNDELNPIDSIHCVNDTDLFTNMSQNADMYNWDFGDGTAASASQSPTHIYSSTGTYTVTLAIKDNTHGCVDTIKKNMYILPVPNASATGNDTCLGSPVQLHVTGDPGLIYSWSPDVLVDDPSSADPIATLTQTTTFTVTASSPVSASSPESCAATFTTTVTIYQPPTNITWDTTVIIGQAVPIPGTAGTGYNYSWTPTNDLSCTTCPTPVSTSTVDIVYTSNVTDNVNCFNINNTFTIHIIPESTVDVPTAFTPDGDGVNDVIYVDGWGIKKLNYFKIYNRWGQLLFESNDLKVGWDGYYLGKLQNMETYVYQVEAVTYTDQDPVQKSGSFKLIR